MAGIWIVCFLLSLIVDLNTANPRHVCHPGTYLHTARNDLDFCQPCTDGVTFMPDSWHTHRNCYNCTQIRDQDLEILVTECTRTHDAEILCTPGYYRRRARSVREQDRCEKCFECEHPTLACQGYHDTVCCGAPNYDAVKNKDGVFICVERPVLCGPGYFLHPQTRQCSPCPPGTFMTEDKHDNTACRLCQTLSDLKAHQTILHDCNNTHQTIIGCESGYFIDSSGNLMTDQVKCSPCQKCEHQGRECDMYHNTVCCDHSGMTIMDTDSGPLCRPTDKTNIPEKLRRNITGETTAVPNWPVCGVGQYLYSSPGDNSVTCLPCKKGTYREEIKHTFPVCKNCKNIKAGNLPSVCLPGTENQPDADTNDRLTLWLSIGNLIMVVCAEITIFVVCCSKKFQGKARSVKLTAFYAGLAFGFVVSLCSFVKTLSLDGWWLDITAGVCTVVSTCSLIYVHKNAAKETIKRLIYRNKRYASDGIHTEQVGRADDATLSKTNKSKSLTQTPMICSV